MRLREVRVALCFVLSFVGLLTNFATTNAAPVSEAVKGEEQPYSIHAYARFTVRFNKFNGQTSIASAAGWKRVLETKEIPKGDYAVFICGEYSLVDVFRLNTTTGEA